MASLSGGKTRKVSQDKEVGLVRRFQVFDFFGLKLRTRLILAAIDGSAISRNVLQQAVRLCTQADDKLLILTVKEPRPALPPNDSRAVVLAHNDDLFALMAELQEPIKTPWEKRDVVGDARSVILESSAGVDYVVIGARGLGEERISDTLMPLGSTAQFVAQHSHAPVLIVRANHHRGHAK